MKKEQIEKNTNLSQLDKQYIDLAIKEQVNLLRDNIRERILKLFADNSISYKLDGESSFKFIQWVGDRSYNSERMQALYQYMLTVQQLSQDDATLLELINESLSEQLIDNPSTVQLPLSGFGGEV